MNYVLHEKWESEQQTKAKENGRKEIIKMKAENNLKREKNSISKLTIMKRLFRRKINKINSPLASSMKKTREHNILNQKEKWWNNQRCRKKKYNSIRYVWDLGMIFLGKWKLPNCRKGKYKQMSNHAKKYRIINISSQTALSLEHVTSEFFQIV